VAQSFVPDLGGRFQVASYTEDDSDTVLQLVVKNTIENKHLYSSGTSSTYNALVQPIHYCLTMSRILQSSNLGSSLKGIVNKDREGDK